MFNFKLESVLNYRKTLEERRLVEFSDEKKRLEGEKEKLESMRQEKSELLEQFRAEQVNPLSSTDIALYFSYIKVVNERENEQKAVVNKATETVEEKKEVLLGAVKDRKIMDTLKEQRFNEYKENVSGVERKIVDETAVLRFSRKEK